MCAEKNLKAEEINAKSVSEQFISLIEKFIRLACIRLPDDVYERLTLLRKREDSPVQRVIYDSYFENLRLARELGRPCCQDTGLPHFYIKAGTSFPHLDICADVLNEAVRRATRSVPLRPNAVNYFDEKNTGDNTAERIPWISWELVSASDEAEITLYFAGAGCSLPGKAQNFKPSDGYQAIIPFVFDVVSGLGVNACPPLVVGIGLGHSIENAALLSKKACLRLIGTSHHHPAGADLERRIMEGLNNLGIGAQGLPGKQAAMAVHLETSGRHIATISCAVTVSCYAHRRGILRLKPDLSWELPMYRNETL